MVATTAAAPKKATAARKAATHPTFLAMIQEAIKAHPEESRVGVSRPTIKKFLAATYKIDISSASNLHNLNNAIKRGAETGALVLPKGNSGRVKLAPKEKKAATAAGKENVAPKKKAPAKKPAAKKAAATTKKPAATKKAATTTTTKKPAAKKAAATTKKPAAAKPKAAATKKAPAKPKAAAK